eukprot:1158563-Pelagomonas_calceolata.AAC.2
MGSLLHNGGMPRARSQGGNQAGRSRESSSCGLRTQSKQMDRASSLSTTYKAARDTACWQQPTSGPSSKFDDESYVDDGDDKDYGGGGSGDGAKNESPSLLS